MGALEPRDEVARLKKELKRRTADIDQLSVSASVKEKEFEVSRRKQMLEFLEEHFSKFAHLRWSQIYGYPIYPGIRFRCLEVMYTCFPPFLPRS